MFQTNSYYSLEQLVDTIVNSIDTNKVIIYYALDNMISSRKKVWNYKKEPGYIIHDTYYVFQPIHNQDGQLPLYYRENPNNELNSEKIPLQIHMTQYSKRVLNPVQDIVYPVDYKTIMETYTKTLLKKTFTIQKKEVLSFYIL